VSEVVPAADLMTRVKALAAAIASKSPVALRYIKDALRASVRAPMEEGLRLERTLFGLVFASEDKKEGVEAFLQKRKADFTGA
jgi:enoyl-CoA hydratase/carnithine racemase